MIVGGLCLLLSCRTHQNPAEILSFHSELTEPHRHLIWRQCSTKRKENTILLKYKHPARNDKVTVFPKIEKQLTFLSAVNRRTAQHFKAETKQHNRKIVAQQKRHKCLFSECLARIFLLNKLFMHISCESLSEFLSLCVMIEIFIAQMKIRLEL